MKRRYFLNSPWNLPRSSPGNFKPLKKLKKKTKKPKKEKIELTSAAITTGAMILMELRLAFLTSLKYFIILYMFVEWVVLLHDCYSLWARPMSRFIFAMQTTCAPKPTAVAQARHTTESCQVETGVKKSLGIDLRIILERLGMVWDCHEKRQIIGSEEILYLFDEDEPSLDEVKEAFSVFDKNKDGYIDAQELQYALSEMGHIHISESNCRLMIDRYDVDKDEKISFIEFLKLMEDCF